MYTVRKLEYNITAEWDGKTVKEFLRHIGCSSAVITGLKNNPKGILIGRKRVTVRKQLSVGDVLTIRIRTRPEDEAKDTLIPTQMAFGILYEDDDILIVDKPAGMPTHPVSNNYTHTLANAVTFYWQQCKRPQLYRPISRLDKDTTGAITIAKHSLSAARLSQDLKERKMERRYIALVEGRLCGAGTVDLPIVRAADSIIKRKTAPKTAENESNRACTHYEVLCEGEQVSVVSLKLETGKTHQIRVHMAAIGHPIVGDWLYGSPSEQIGRPALHSRFLRLVHPVTEEIMEFYAPLPADMQQVIDNYNLKI